MITVTRATPALKEQARHLLLAHELTNANLLWVLEDQEDVEVVLDDESAPAAVALLYRLRINERRGSKHPALRRLWLEARNPDAARSLIHRLPRAETVYARVHRDRLREAIEERYQLAEGRELVYFRGDVPGFRPKVEFRVALEREVGSDVLDLLEASGLTTEGSLRLVARCQGGYVARVAGVPLGVCCLSRKTEHVAEIRAVFVREGARGQGVGRAVVSAAAQAARARGLIPTYCTGDDNLPSQALVRSLGFQQYHRVLYAVAYPRK